MADQELYVRALSESGRTLVGDDAVGDVLHDLAGRVAGVLGVTAAGVLLADGGSIKSVTAIGEVAAALEQAQEDAREGPGVDAHRGGEPVLVGDLREDRGRWPAFAARALELGAVAAAGIPMRLDGTGLGALNLYAMARRDWPAGDLAIAQALADLGASYLAHTSELERSRRAAAQLQAALAGRVVLEQAKGILAAERSISVDEAFGLIRRLARTHRTPVQAVAEAIVNRRLSSAGGAPATRRDRHAEPAGAGTLSAAPPSPGGQRLADVTGPGGADSQAAVMATGFVTVEMRTSDLDDVIQRILTAGLRLSNALAGGAGTVAAVEDAVGALDQVVRIVQSAVFWAWEPADGLDAVAARLADAAHDLSRLVGTAGGDISVRDAAYCVHRAQVAVSEARSALTAGHATAAEDRA